MSASLHLGPPKDSPGMLFLKAQFCTPPRPQDVNLAGRVALVTGCTGGLGLEASRQLLDCGLSGLIMAVRSIDKGEKLAAEWRLKHPEADIRVWFLEMESYDSIRELARRARELPRLDIAILNAGMQAAYFTTVPATGHEKYIQVNYLSTTLLAILLLPVLSGSPGSPGRLTIVSSGTARGAVLSPSHPILPFLDDKRNFNPVGRYAVSKLLGHLFVMELIRHMDDRVVVNLVDPGLVKNTDLQRGAPAVVAAAFYCMKALLGRSVPVGASTYVDAVAVKGKESHGCFVSSWKISSYAAFIYTPEGDAAREQLWAETMKEFEFVGAEAILESLNSQAESHNHE